LIASIAMHAWLLCAAAGLDSVLALASACGAALASLVCWKIMWRVTRRFGTNVFLAQEGSAPAQCDARDALLLHVLSACDHALLHTHCTFPASPSLSLSFGSFDVVHAALRAMESAGLCVRSAAEPEARVRAALRPPCGRGIYVGRVIHQRTPENRAAPTAHRLERSVWMPLLEWRDENEHALDDSWVASANTSLRYLAARPIWLRPEDFWPRKRVLAWLSSTLDGTQLEPQDTTVRVWLLAYWTTLGVGFNSVHFYLVQRAEQWVAMLAVVRNTPFNETVPYAFRLADADASGVFSCAPVRKAMHVSPFMSMNNWYHVRVFIDSAKPLAALPERIWLRWTVANVDTGHAELYASLDLHLRGWSDGALVRTIVEWPCVALGSYIGIYWHALCLFLRGAKVYDHADSATRHSQHVRAFKTLPELPQSREQAPAITEPG
jgi:DUF1365 family protein